MTQPSTSHAHDDRVTSSGGLELNVRSWRPPSSPRAVVAIVPGFNSHSGYYEWVAGKLTENGFAAYAVDLRGRGKSDGERFYVDKFSDYVRDASSMVHLAKSREAGVPVFMLGHSAGGVVACIYALEYPTDLAGL